MSDDDLLKLRFEFAWKHFEYHARQRVTMFNFFLIITGILANAYVGALKESSLVAAILGAVGFMLALAFLGLDIRNRKLVGFGQAVLLKLEKESIFKGFKDGDQQLGFLYREKCDGRTPIINHSFLVRLVEIVVGALFLGSAFYAGCTQ